jgi:hypothetical protein
LFKATIFGYCVMKRKLLFRYTIYGTNRTMVIRRFLIKLLQKKIISSGAVYFLIYGPIAKSHDQYETLASSATLSESQGLGQFLVRFASICIVTAIHSSASLTHGVIFACSFTKLYLGCCLPFLTRINFSFLTELNCFMDATYSKFSHISSFPNQKHVTCDSLQESSLVYFFMSTVQEQRMSTLFYSLKIINS